MPNKLSNFWQELKRRNVVRVITVYAGVAFVILELVDIVSPSLRLPEWTMNLMIVLLCAGFIIAVILSWIYDIHPKGGIVKTEPAHTVQEEDIPKSSNSWKIASYISFVVIVGLIVLNIIPRADRSGKLTGLETSIAVLPFENMSSNEEDEYLGGAFCDEIIMELQKIKAFDRVLSRTSTMQYEKERPTIPEIAEKLNVNYIVEGSIQRSQQNVRIRVQVIRAKNEDHIWGETYDREWKDIFSIQDEIAFQVASTLKMTLTPEEVELIERIPTTSLTAHDFYQRGREEYWKGNLDRAEELYNEALRYDSTYARAILGFASVYWDRNYWKEYYTESFMDSAVILVDKALSFDPQLSEAYVFRGSYNYIIGHLEVANEAYNKALSLNPNEWTAYRELGKIYADNDIIRSIQNYQKAISLNKEPEVLPDLLRQLSNVYSSGGFSEEGDAYRLEALKLDKDSVIFYNNLMIIEILVNNNHEKGLEYAKRALALDSTNRTTLEWLGDIYASLGKKEEALYYKTRYLEILKEEGVLRINDMHRAAYIYWLNGMKEEADHYFDLQFEYSTQDIELNRPSATRKYSYYDLAGIFAFRGETEKAIEYLRVFNQKQVMLRNMLFFIKSDPLLNSIRDEPEFQQIVRDVEAKYQAEHERVRQWLEENEMY